MINRRFPPPWTVKRLPGGFKVIDANGQSLAYFYARENDNGAGTGMKQEGWRATSPSCQCYSVKGIVCPSKKPDRMANTTVGLLSAWG